MKENNSMGSNFKSLDQLGNILFDEQKGYCSIKLNPNVYSLGAIKFAAHHLSDEVNVIIDVDAKGTVSIEMFLKGVDKSIKDVFWKFNESLIGYSVYLIQSDRNKELREAILNKALSVE